MQSVKEANFHVVQMKGPFRNEIGEMTEMAVYTQVRMHLGMEAAEAALIALEEKGTATVRYNDWLGVKITLEIRKIGAW